jgi:putative nucleotidyltransferase with HDIG domain
VRVGYRMRQFWEALNPRLSAEELKQAQDFLDPALMALFLGQPRSEQAHSLRLLNQLLEGGETHSDLLVAALLHDVGKSRHPLHLWERVLIVLGKKFAPNLSQNWGQAELHGWRRAFVIAAQHPQWGAEMAAEAGASPLTVELIRRHQSLLPEQADSLKESLLHRLQSVDNQN